MTYEEFVAYWVGKPADYDHSYGNQCVDLFNFYNRDVVGQGFVGTPTTGGAADLWNDYNALPGYTKVPNSPSAVPPKGAVVIWAANTKATGPAGHVGIASGVGDGSYFISFDQNYPTGSLPHLQRHTYDGVLGWYVPNNQGGTMPSSQDVADALTLQLLYNTGLLRQPSDQEIKARANQTVELVARDILSSDEHKQIQADRDLGVQARTGGWKDQTAQVQSQQDTIDGLNTKLTAAVAELATAQDELQAAQKAKPPVDTTPPVTTPQNDSTQAPQWFTGFTQWLKDLISQVKGGS